MQDGHIHDPTCFLEIRVLIGAPVEGYRVSMQAVTAIIYGAEAGKGDVELEDDDLDAGAWGDPDLDLEPHADGEANGEADYERPEGEPEEGEDDEGGWEMEVPSPLLLSRLDLSRDAIVLIRPRHRVTWKFLVRARLVS